MFGLGRLRFSRQVFVLQTALTVPLIALVAALTGWLLRDTLMDEYGERALGIARAVAADQQVVAATQARQQGGALEAQVVEITRRTGALFVVITDDRGIRLAHPDPANVGKLVSTDPSDALAGREVVGVVQLGTLGFSVRSKTPVLVPGGRSVGEVSVGFAITTAGRDSDRLLLLLGVFAALATLLALVASWVLSRRLRRVTHGVEPAELTAMVYEHEAVLRGVGEGVLAVDTDGRVSVRNAEAERLLGMALPVGSAAGELPISPRIRRALAKPPVDNVLALAGDRVLVVNSRPVSRDDRPLGTVATLRDRTDLDSITRELDAVRSLTDGLRAQRHEFSNRLHTLSGLLQLDHREEAMDYLQSLTETGAGRPGGLHDSVGDPYLRALLLAKSEQAREKGVDLRLSDDSSVPALAGDPLAVLAVLGNLLDNALRAAKLGPRPPWVEVTLLAQDGALHLSVQDSGAGVTVEPPEAVFEEGVTTKLTPGHGLGLTLARHEARRMGGDLWLADVGGNGSGALFVAALPGTLGGAK